MRKIVILISTLLFCISSQISGSPRDTVIFQTGSDTLRAIEQFVKKPHSPHKATVMAMVLPGSGQVYNGQWWKVPILYGGIAADIYGITWNQKHFKQYREAYVEWVRYINALAENPDTPYPENPAWDKIPKSFDVKTDPYFQQDAGRNWFKNTLNNRKNNFKRNRDLCYIIMAAIYAVNIIDATVYAHFYDFEIAEDLSFRIQPTSSYSPLCGGTVGLTLTFNF